MNCGVMLPPMQWTLDIKSPMGPMSELEWFQRALLPCPGGGAGALMGTSAVASMMPGFPMERYLSTMRAILSLTCTCLKMMRRSRLKDLRRTANVTVTFLLGAFKRPAKAMDELWL